MSQWSEAELSALPIFPLPDVVLFPGTRLPLHLFEARYRAMIEHCMTEGPRALAVVKLRPGWEKDYEGKPPIHEIAGAGHIVSHARRADGTHDVVLSAVSRVRLHELESSSAFRLGRAEILTDHAADDVPPTDVVSLVSLASEVAGLLHRTQPDFALGLEGDERPGALADRLANRCVVDAELRQRILEAVHVPTRVRLVTSAVAELHLRLARRSSRPSEC